MFKGHLRAAMLLPFIRVDATSTYRVSIAVIPTILHDIIGSSIFINLNFPYVVVTGIYHTRQILVNAKFKT